MKEDKVNISKTILFCSRIILGGVFIYASIDKIANPNGFANVVRGFGLLPEILINSASIVLPLLELWLGIFLVVGLFVRYSALLSGILLIVFLIMILIKIASGSFSITAAVMNNSLKNHGLKVRSEMT